MKLRPKLRIFLRNSIIHLKHIRFIITVFIPAFLLVHIPEIVSERKAQPPAAPPIGLYEASLEALPLIQIVTLEKGVLREPKKRLPLQKL